MAYQEEESLESWLNKATHPTNRQEDWEYIIGFCDQINKELEGPQIAVTLLVHKIHSPQEWEALQALTVLEACMKNCGRRFHNEVGKYRFLNELIKVVSPKYMGDGAHEKVKQKIVEILYSWTQAFPTELKISEAYQTLRRQGECLVTHDPELPLDRTLIPSPPTRPKHPVFENEDMGKLLAELLRSKNPEDLQEANRLIKSMVKEDDARVQKVTKRMLTLEEVNINVKLLTDMLSHYNKESSSDSDREIIRELYERCDKLRRAAFKMATESEDHDNTLGDILQASDDLSRVINSYKKIVEEQPINGSSEEEEPPSCCQSGTKPFLINLIDLTGVDSPDVPHPAASLPVSAHLIATPIPVLPPPPKCLTGSGSSSPSHPPLSQASTTLSLLDDELLSLGKTTCVRPLDFVPPVISTHASPSSAVLLQGPAPGSPAATHTKALAVGSAPASPLFHTLSPCHPPTAGSLSNVHVPLEAIRPSKVLPVTAYDKDGVRVLLHFASDCPPGRPDVLVMVVSMLNTAPLPVHTVLLQAAVPKSMKVKLQPPSGTELAPLNPILPPASITQIILLANPTKDKVRLRYKLEFTLGDRRCTEVGEVNQFPPQELWGRL
uniref:Golgi associated, gamma adaptin ear containing, ARF binding protein 3b n=1 Tax=Gouania willdenowi TaxID=441366 RepID=A0A8C5HBF1_GOUWI